MTADVVGPDDVERFRRDGFVVLRGFYDVAGEIEPIRRGVHEIIGRVAEAHGVDLGERPYDPATFDAGYLRLKDVDRRLAGMVYDGVKQMAAFVRLVASPRNDELFRGLRQASLAGVAGGGSGIRIDNPGETRYLAWWHQEYPAQGRSPGGTVLWSPLRPVGPETGPVEILVGSHAEGVLACVDDDDGTGRTGAYAMRLADEAEVVARHVVTSASTEPGDLVVMDYLTVHRSGENRSDVSRWTMQMRYFAFDEPVGARRGWAGPPVDVTAEVGTR
ncbi:MAG: phytanoyl-CoA dioxygenase family protein [Acidimicrobiales bacterium]